MTSHRILDNHHEAETLVTCPCSYTTSTSDYTYPRGAALVVMSSITIPELFQLPELNGINLREVTITQLQQYYTAGKFTSSEYVDFCIEAIQKVSLMEE